MYHINGLAFSPDNTKLATASSDETVRIWDSESGEEKLVLEGHDDSLNAVVSSPDGPRLASASHDESIIIWNAAYGKRLQQLKGHNFVVNDLRWCPMPGTEVD